MITMMIIAKIQKKEKVIKLERKKSVVKGRKGN
jgi:hypothetical protein